MSRRISFLLGFLLLLSLGVLAVPPLNSHTEREIGVPRGDEPTTKLWLKNLGEDPLEATVEQRSPTGRATGVAAVALAPGELAAAPSSTLGEGSRIRARGDARLFLLRAPEGFDPRGAEFERSQIRLLRERGQSVARVSRPDWARDLLAWRGSEAALLHAGKAGQAAIAAPKNPRAYVTVALSLLTDESSISLTLRDRRGEALSTFSVTSSVPVTWRMNLGPAAEITGGRIELQVHAGQALGTVTTVEPAIGKSSTKPIFTPNSTGVGYFNQTINWSGVLYYTVSGGPANTCGDLQTFRNGSWLYSTGWLCTDASGGATKGPWYWSNQANDQTDDQAFIVWPGGTSTTGAKHIWDKTCAQTYRDSADPAPNSSPSSYSGHATDTQWGAGFDTWSNVSSVFWDRSVTPNLYWTPSAGAYSVTTPTAVSGTLSGYPSFNASWSTSFPPAGAHTPGHTYEWYTCVDDGSCGYCTPHLVFTR